MTTHYVAATDGTHDYSLPVEQARTLYTTLTYALAAALRQEQLDACLAQRRQWEQDAGVADGGA